MKSLTVPLCSLVIVATLGAPAVAGQPEFIACSHLGDLFSVEIDGTQAFIGTIPDNITEVEYDTMTGRLFASQVFGMAQGPAFLELDPMTGGTLSNVSVANPYTGMEFVGSTLYAARNTPPAVAVGFADFGTVDTADGSFTSIGGTGFLPVSGLAYDEMNGVMYGVTGGTPSPSLLTVNLGTGTASVVGPLGNGNPVGGIAFAPDGTLYGITVPVSEGGEQTLYQIDTTTGVATQVGGAGPFGGTGMASLQDAIPVELQSFSID